MSENLDLVRSIYAAHERGDYSSVGWAHPEIEYVVADGPEPGSWTGVAGMAEAWRGLSSAAENLRVLAEEYRELDDQRVLVLHRYTGRGKSSGMALDEVHAKAATVMHVRDGKVARLVGYNERDRALADLGLKE